MRLVHVILALIVVLVVSSGSAQIFKGFGAKGGAAAANQEWEYTTLPSLDTKNRWGYTAGGFVELLNLPHLALVVELMYTQKGMRLTVPVVTQANPDETGRSITLSPRVDYLAIPILAKVQIPSQLLTPYVLLGPRLDLRLAHSGEGFDLAIEKFSKSEFGVTTGAGIESDAVLPVTLLLEFRYHFHVADAFSNNFLRVRNRSFDVLAGIRVNIAGRE